MQIRGIKDFGLITERLNKGDRSERDAALSEIAHLIEQGSISRIPNQEVNNHVHSTFSFSPYSPSGAAFGAWAAGLQAVGLMDHDSISGAREMLDACRTLNIASTIGFEVRVNFTGTSVEGLRINNPDSMNIVYMTVHGVPSAKIGDAEKFIAPLREERNIRNRKEVAALNKLTAPFGIEEINFDIDVIGISMSQYGGSITERHILAALGEKLIDRFGKGEVLVAFLEEDFKISLPDVLRTVLSDSENPHYLYDLLGSMKGDFLLRFFIQPNEIECPGVKDVVAFANSIGAIPAYAYLGDVADSPTGDKKAQSFEDAFLDDLMMELKQIGFKAVTYMPPRNTRKQMDRIQSICREYNFMEISGVDINSSRQLFNCPEILLKENRHLIDTTWALIAHEKLTGADSRLSLFSNENPLAVLSLEDRVSFYSKTGQQIDWKYPEKLDDLIKKVFEYGN